MTCIYDSSVMKNVLDYSRISGGHPNEYASVNPDRSLIKVSINCTAWCFYFTYLTLCVRILKGKYSHWSIYGISRFRLTFLWNVLGQDKHECGLVYLFYSNSKRYDYNFPCGIGSSVSNAKNNLVHRKEPMMNTCGLNVWKYKATKSTRSVLGILMLCIIIWYMCRVCDT